LEGFWLIVAHEGAKMGQKPVASQAAEQHVREIRRTIRKKHSAEEKIRIELEGDFAAMLALGQSKNPRRTDPTGVQVTLVAGTRSRLDLLLSATN